MGVCKSAQGHAGEGSLSKGPYYHPVRPSHGGSCTFAPAHLLLRLFYSGAFPKKDFFCSLQQSQQHSTFDVSVCVCAHMYAFLAYFKRTCIIHHTTYRYRLSSSYWGLWPVCACAVECGTNPLK